MKTKKIIQKLREDADMWFKGACPSNGVLPSMAADRLEMLSVFMKNMSAKLEAVKKERNSMAAALKARGGCDTCKYCTTEWDQEPCNSCRLDPSAPEWKWKGE